MNAIKQTFFAVICTMTTTLSLAQLYTPSGAVNSTTGGNNVGVGMNNPESRLSIGASGNTGLLLLKAYSTQQEQIQEPGGTLPPIPIDTEYQLRMTYQVDPITGVLGYETPKTVFNVDRQGKTQIGDFPIVPGDDYLAIRSSVGVYNNTTEYFRLRFANNNHELFWVSNNNRNFRFKNSNTGAVPLTLAPSGKVGVGTSNFAGSHSLYVKGLGVHEEVWVQGEAGWGQDDNYVRLLYGTRPEFRWKSTAGEPLEFKSGDNTPLRLSPQGKVGVNTSNFVGSYSLYIKGTTIAEEIFVKIEDDWGDFVFDPDYVLQPLSEVEAFVKKHKHLPGIAPAAEIHSSGIPLGETERMLVIKVEELTLYLIELKKEIDDLKVQLQEAEKQK